MRGNVSARRNGTFLWRLEIAVDRRRDASGRCAVLALDRLGAMSLEESSLERIGDRCEECGAKLTPQEIQAAMESGGPALCSIHALEDEPGLAADEAGFIEGE
jgi:hypothetical protein